MSWCAGKNKSNDMTPQEINISYGISGNITFTVTWHPASISEAITAVNGFLAKLGAEKPVKVEPKAVMSPKPAVKPVKKTMTDRRGFHRWTDNEKREAIRMYQGGENLDAIAEKFHSTPLSVQKIMQKAGVKRPWPTKGNPSKLEEAADEPKDEPV